MSRHCPILIFSAALSLACSACRQLEAQIRPHAPNAFQLITGADAEEEKLHWDRLFKYQPYVYGGTRPDDALASNLSLLPPKGRALVLPMEEGRNAVFLARKGYDVVGIDFSEVALRNARRLARKDKVMLTAVNADLNHYDFDSDSYDVVVDMSFAQDPILQKVKRALKEGGVVFFKGDFNTKNGERPHVKERFKDFDMLSYRKECHDGIEHVTLVARKPYAIQTFQ